MILKITVNDNDFTEYIEQFVKDPVICVYKVLSNEKLFTKDEMLELFKQGEQLRKLLYHTSKYTTELTTELCELITKAWTLFVKYILNLKDWQDDKTREYLINNFKVKFQKSLTPKWENNEVVYMCLGYQNKYWTF